MLKRILSTVILVLFFGTIGAGDAYAAKKKTASGATSKIVYVCSKKEAKAVKKPHRAVIDCTKKKKKVARKKSIPKPPCSDVVCLARLILGETGLEDEKSRLAVGYVGLKYGQEQNRSMQAELYSGRYSVTLCRECMMNVLETRGKPWKRAMVQAAHLIRIYPEPPDKRIADAKNYVRWEHASVSGARWLEDNTCPLTEDGSEVRIGKHVFLKECTKEEAAKLVVALIPIPSLFPSIPPTPLPMKPKAPSQMIASGEAGIIVIPAND